MYQVTAQDEGDSLNCLWLGLGQELNVGTPGQGVHGEPALVQQSRQTHLVSWKTVIMLM